jgi:hypothetical protein
VDVESGPVRWVLGSTISVEEDDVETVQSFLN